jgi:hypothetical protein
VDGDYNRYAWNFIVVLEKATGETIVVLEKATGETYAMVKSCYLLTRD